MDMVTITSRMPADLTARLDEYAARHSWSRATAIRVLIAEALNQEEE